MNYRHAYHAGNFADVLKHVTIIALIEALTKKKRPIVTSTPMPVPGITIYLPTPPKKRKSMSAALSE